MVVCTQHVPIKMNELYLFYMLPLSLVQANVIRRPGRLFIAHNSYLQQNLLPNHMDLYQTPGLSFIQNGAYSYIKGKFNNYYNTKNNAFGKFGKDINKYNESLVRDKIYSTIEKSKKNIDAEIGIVKKINSRYQKNNAYKIGYIVGYLNKTYEELSKIHTDIGKNKENWDSWKLLYTYENIKKRSYFIRQTFRVLISAIKDSKRVSSSKYPESNAQGANKSNPPDNDIAWSYYSDY